MKVLFDTKQEAIFQYPNYTPKNSKKIYTFGGTVDYCKIGSMTKTHNLAWRIGRLLKAIKFVLSFWDLSKENRKLISKNLKEFKTSHEKIVDIYIKRHAETQKIKEQGFNEVRMQQIVQEKNCVPKEEKHQEVVVIEPATEAKPAEAIKPQPDMQQLENPPEEDPDAEILNNYDKLYVYLHESLWSFENNAGKKKNLSRIISKISNVMLERLVDSNKMLHWREVLKICYFRRDLSQNILDIMTKRVKQGLENKQELIIFPLSEIVGLSLLKLSLHPVVLDILKYYYFSMSNGLFSETLADIPEEFLDKFLLIFNMKSDKKEDVEPYVKQLIGQCCERTNLNLLPTKLFFNFLSKTEFGLTIPNLETITSKKITETIQFIYQIINEKGLFDDGDYQWEKADVVIFMLNLFDNVPQNETRINQLSTILLEMDKEEIIQFLTSDYQEFDVAARILFNACQDTNHKKFEVALDAFLEAHQEALDISDEWKILTKQTSIDQALYMLSKKHQGLENFKDALFAHAIEKDAKKCCEQIPMDRFLNYFERLNASSRNDHNKFVQFQKLISEARRQNILRPILKHAFLSFQLISGLTVEELKVCVNCSARDPKPLVHPNVNDIFYILFSYFLQKMKEPYGEQAKEKFFDIYDAIVKDHPTKIDQALDGIIFVFQGQATGIMDYNSAEIRKWLEENMALFGQLIDRHENVKKQVNDYLSKYSDKFFDDCEKMLLGQGVRPIDAFQLALATKYKASFTDILEWIWKMNDKLLPFFFLQLKKGDQMSLIKVLFEKMKIEKDLAYRNLTAIRAILTNEELQEQYLDLLDVK